MSVRCAACGTENVDGRRFCGNCGAGLGWTCAGCEWNNETQDKFCGGCGQPQASTPSEQAEVSGSSRRSAIRHISFRPISKTDRLVVDSPEIAAPSTKGVERRQVTALFADLTGYSTLTNELDGERVHEITNRYRAMVDEIIESYDGIVPRHFGDAVLGLFGYPMAHSNDPERAIRTALAIHSSMAVLNREFERELEVHIGIASGTALVDSSGRQLELTGRAVILGSRLYDLADPGQTLIADTTYRAVNKVARCTEVGERSLKGFDSPARVWRLDGLHTVSGAEQSGPIVGRRRELDLVRTVLDSCVISARGQTLYVRGEAGIGKTRLLAEAGVIANGKGFTPHATHILDFGSEIGRDPIRVLVRSLLGLSVSNTPDAQMVSDVAATLDIDDVLLPHLFQLLDVGQSQESLGAVLALDYSARQQRLNDLLGQLVRGRSRETPLLLIVEDVHWADRQLLDQLTAIADIVRTVPVVLMLSSRPDGDPFEVVSALPAMTTITLDSLDDTAMRDLAVQLESHNSKMVDLCVERSGGNPLFLEQLLRSKDEMIEETLPGSITSIVQSRVDRLERHDRLALQAASILGQRFDANAVAFLLESDRYDPTSLIENHLVRRQGVYFAFAHALIREGVYGALLSDMKEALHARAANWYRDRDVALWAQHLRLARDTEAVAAFVTASRVKIAAHEYTDALALVRQGEEIATNAAERVALGFNKGEASYHIGDIQETIDAYQSALELCEDPAERCRAHIALAASLRIQERLDEALEHLEIGESLARESNLTNELGQIHHQRGNIYFPRGDLDACLEQHELARAIAAEVASPEAEANALSGLGDANYQRGRMHTAAASFKNCIDIARKHDLIRIVVANSHMLGLARYFQARLHDGLDDSLAGIEYAAKIGHQRAEMAARSSIGPIQLDLGDAEGAREQANRGLALAKQLGARRFEPLCITTLARVAAAEDGRDKAIGQLNEALAISFDTGPSFTAPWILGALADIEDDPVRRAKALADGGELLKQGSLAHCYHWYYRFALSVYQREGNEEAINDVAARVKQLTAEESVPWIDIFVDSARLAVGASDVDRNDLSERISNAGFVGIDVR